MLRIHRFTVATLAIALCASAPAVAQAQDLRSPDAIAAGQPKAPQAQDYRTPDAVNPVEPTTDLRAPDNRFGQPTGGPAPARVRIVEVPSQWLRLGRRRDRRSGDARPRDARGGHRHGWDASPSRAAFHRHDALKPAHPVRRAAVPPGPPSFVRPRGSLRTSDPRR